MDIYGTIGPACAKAETLTEMFRLGMTGLRLNLSHTELADCLQWINIIKEAGKAAGVSPRLLIDLKGPELRIGKLSVPLELQEGERVLLSPQEKERTLETEPLLQQSDGMKNGLNIEEIPVPGLLFSALEPGREILLDDGKLFLTVTEAVDTGVCCQVQRGGTLTSRKSIALPGVELNLPTLTESDRRNIRGAKKCGVTGVMLPFVRRAQDLKNLRQELEEAEALELEIFAKIENMDGVRNLEELLPFADHVVIARGDLGNSMPLWELPAVQAEVAAVCQKAGKPFMVVTQMLASMEQRPVPTRAEVSDIFRAVSEGAASVMVTGETAAGSYPIETMKYLCRTVESARKYLKK